MIRVCRLVFVCLLLIVTFINADDEYDISEDRIDEDYFYGTALRTKAFTEEFCLRKLPSFVCELDCFRNHICVNGRCKCIDSETLMAQVPKQNLEFIDLTTMLKEDSRPELKRPTRTRAIQVYNPRPVLRHHIAHFCPNLDDARVCIRKCMKVGKPAFCGKDHVCYCGHKYTDPVEDKQADADAIYAEFKDMYEKYFGKGYRPKLKLK